MGDSPGWYPQLQLAREVGVPVWQMLGWPLADFPLVWRDRVMHASQAEQRARTLSREWDRKRR